MARPPKLNLPLRDGVAASALACPAGPWPLVLDFLTERLPLVSREDWADRLGRGDVLDDQGQALPPDAPLSRCQGRRLYYWRWLPSEPQVPGEVRILHQDDHLLVADKPHFLPVTPKGRYIQQTLLTRLRRLTGLADLSPLHRLDRETAGLVLFSVQPLHRDAYQRLFRDRSVAKVYEAIAPDPSMAIGLAATGPGTATATPASLRFPLHLATRLQEHPVDFMQMQTVPGEPNAFTDVDLIERLPGGWARYLLRPSTGAKHQLRAQMAHLGLPLQGDRIYPVLQPVEAEPDFSHPLQLLAREIAFTDPVTGQPRRFETALRLAV
ncbi:pseudouridine synthase [Roseateles terrae]|uniref:tRNA pseudouridine32 synthase/23S rRNA pseudouridine746 synthase n=1 Tax=Roseateles terrae TaxID=431060 RepID=A0ABR6H063_9BURK|nr:pseudouridine synthase [Roseateles terrae]MBB3196934.1 tRNA pseudouridine32 synthase/23S rRNA pseudouridine746 synthase [Roseateles terrae]OWQ84523.1 pseudouridine synthase [Roseateles terrae]